MTYFIAWIAPPGAVVDPPVHPQTLVDVIYSDGDAPFGAKPAGGVNWSAEGDGPKIVAYRVAQEYVEPVTPREWWTIGSLMFDTRQSAIAFRQLCADQHGSHHLSTPTIRVREVME